MTGLNRIILHWTAGGGRASAVDRQHYHRLVEHDGRIVPGTEALADNIVTSDGDYAAHTRNLNTGSIGVALCGMRDAIEVPFSAGPSPLTEVQVDAACALVAELCRAHGIPVTRETVLTHAEVQPTLGVRQLGKWDITRLPYKPDVVGAYPVGDYLRAKIKALLGEAAPASNRPVLRFGDRGADVRVLQEDLAGLRYFAGRRDGRFDTLTRAALLAFQADNGLATDAVAGALTWAALARAQPRPLRDIAPADLRAEGSSTMKGGDAAEVALTGGGLLAAVPVLRDLLAETQGLLPTLQENWPVLLALGALGLGYILIRQMKAARLEDARTGAHLGR
ncbi:peptidoglycan recognition protein family protein [Sagittula stellata]|uniref:N-acetylmuramoyl-L-alanine amidase n=1 Tax=Sagittula stellata (strain ATCC 700073 / DSM 11524 / E-37) TaxID=388399 RepID=A3K213_SAGS3|nr:peptidoglycan-binding domain-containing protein [Sagittula stellata]EBA08959.1 hypothetical protein SSE37_04915 [Sagittula stellata E-37]